MNNSRLTLPRAVRRARCQRVTSTGWLASLLEDTQIIKGREEGFNKYFGSAAVDTVTCLQTDPRLYDGSDSL